MDLKTKAAASANGIRWAEVDFWPIMIVLAIIIIGGLIGGYAAYLTSTHPAAEGSRGPARAPWAPNLLLGFIAAACVPLFLAILQSDLIENIFEANGAAGAAPFDSFLVLFGFCLIAAYSARTFIDSVSRRVLRDLEDVKHRQEHVEAQVDKAADKAAEAKQEIEEVQKEIAEVAESIDEADAPPPPEAESLDADMREPSPITDEERRVLEAMRKRTYRTRTGIAEDSGIAKHRISEMLEFLADRRLALPTRSPRTGGERWILTKRGIAALEDPG